jgi:hypothetical protein
MSDPVRLQILRHLAKGQSLTPLEALNLFGCLSLSQRIGELKREGWPIESELVAIGHGKKVSRYTYKRVAA